jgi:hypothetical protein
MSIPNRFDIVKDVDAAHAHLLQTNDGASIKEFYWRAAWALHRADRKFGMLRKVVPEKGHEIPGAGYVAVDAVCYDGEHNIVDIIQAAGDHPRRGYATWGEDDRRRPTAVWVQPPPYPGEPTNGGGGEEPVDKDNAAQLLGPVLAEILATLKTIAAKQDAATQAMQDQAAAVTRTSTELKAAVEKGVKIRF